MRRHWKVDIENVETAKNEALLKVIALLLPIRRQRLSRSESQQQQQERAVHLASSKCDVAEQQLDILQRHHQQLRNSFTIGACKQEQLCQELEQERRVAASLQAKMDELSHFQQLKVAQQQRLVLAQDKTRACKREVEKLEYLMQNSESLK